MRCVSTCARLSIACAVALATAAAISTSAWAHDRPAPGGAPEVAQRFEFWAGAQAFDQVWSLYSGVTAAPFAGIQQDGLRIRIAGGLSGYSYKDRPGGGRASFADVLVGYHRQLGPVTVKAFGGLMLADHQLEPDGPAATVRGPGTGAKVALETWWNVSERVWSSLDLSWGTYRDSYASRARLGWRLVPALSVGLEAEANGSVDCDIARGGGFVRYEWASGELSVSGGLSSDKLLDGATRASFDAGVPYATVSWLTRF